MYNSKSHRRKFLQTLGIAGLGSMAFENHTASALSPYDSPREIPSILGKEANEAYWELLKRQFRPEAGILNVNAANLCPAPHFVLEEVAEHYKNLSGNVSFQHRAHFGEKRKMALELLSNFLNAPPDCLGITRNTSEANNIVINGLDLSPGDEVVIWRQNHPSNADAWKMRSKRMGFHVVEFEVDTLPENPSELAEKILATLSSRTRALAFSHISNVSGLALPVKEICIAASKRGIMTLVDGAQALGCIDLDLTDLGCTFYTASTHKWLMGPMENGVLYVHPDHKDRLWPNIIAAGWTEERSSVDSHLCALGQRNTPSTAALSSILDFHQFIGKERIEARIRQMNTHLKLQLRAKIGDIEFVTPIAEELSAGVTIFNIENRDSRAIYQRLYEDFGIAAAPTGGIRISPTINSTIRDMDKIVDAVSEIVGG